MTASPLLPHPPHRRQAAPAPGLAAGCPAARPRPLPRFLAGTLALLLAAPALAAPGQPPRPEDFPDYARYIEASINYQRSLGQAEPEKPKESGDASKLCRDDGGDSKDKKKNSCEGKYLTVEKQLPDDARQPSSKAKDEPTEPSYENLEDAISRAAFDPAGVSGDVMMGHRPQGLPEELSSGDLSSTGVAGLLGLLNDASASTLLGAVAPTGRFGRSGASGTPSPLDEASALKISLDEITRELTQLDQSFLGTLFSFGDGYAMVQATTTINENGGIHMDLQSQVHTAVYIVDRDGVPGTEWSGAGAATIDHLDVLIPHLSVDIQAVRGTTQDNSLLGIDAYSPEPITVNLANTRIGAAAATADGSWIGESTSFLEFGPQSVLTVNAGTRVSVSLGQPDGLKQAFVTLNGTVGDISIGDISLVDHQGGGMLHLGKVSLSGINLVNTRVMLDNNSVVVDLGRGFTNLGVGIERVFLGSPSEGAYIGDFYMQNARINELRFSATPH